MPQVVEQALKPGLRVSIATKYSLPSCLPPRIHPPAGPKLKTCIYIPSRPAPAVADPRN